MTKTKTQTKTKVAYELRLATGFKIATMIVMGSGLLAFALFSTIWKLKA